MKNSKNKIIIIGALFALAGSVFYFKQSTKTTLSEKVNFVKNSSTNVETNTLPKKLIENDLSAITDKLSSFKSFELNEKKSLIIISSFFNDAVNGELPMDSLVEDLKDLKLKPLVMKDENEYTGTLNIVRTQDTLPGTRYLHAQYYEGEDTPSFLQHLSFEFRGGDNAFEMVKKVIQEQLKITTAPVRQSEKYTSWAVGNKNIWIKKLDLEDISKDDPHNSYDLKNDVGTIRVTAELEIH